MRKLFFSLLKDYCDALISLQFKGTGDRTLDGGFYCRACRILHGRAHDAIYPFVVMTKLTGDAKYLDAAKAVFEFGEGLRCTDGSFYNDAQSTWPCTTVFHTVSLCEALTEGRELLDAETCSKWEERLSAMGKWLYENLDENYHAVINYPVTNSLAMALVGKYFNREDYLARARHLADYSMQRITENGLLYGEAYPRDEITPLGCRLIDIGYNVEESIPALVKYAFVTDDKKMKDTLAAVLLGQLDFMLPDGAWDNSIGIRNNKWTYWGSRTSDGCSPAYILLADRHPAFAEAAWRNTELLAACTHDGLLYGGPHYKRHGARPCTHHTFEHACALAFSLLHMKNDISARASLPVDNAAPLSHYPEIGSYKIAHGDYRSTLTGTDAQIGEGMHVGGGTLTMLWKYGKGPMIAASVIDYKLVESHNMQLPLDKEHHRSLVPRLRLVKNNTDYVSGYFTTPIMKAEQKHDISIIEVKGGLSDKKNHRLPNDIDRVFRYTFSKMGVKVELENASGAEFILPLIEGELEITMGTLDRKDDIFFLTGGFEATEYTIKPNAEGKMAFWIR